MEVSSTALSTLPREMIAMLFQAIRLLPILLLLTSTSGVQAGDQPTPRKQPDKWRALHLLVFKTDKDLDILSGQIPKLAQMGVNVLILEIDYTFQFQSHPELRLGNDPITSAGAREFAAVCRKNGIRLIPGFQALGHQSWKSNTFPLLKVYPQLDLTPGAFPENKGIYCREWDPLNPEVNKIVFPLMDEIVDAFQADALHVGMDEVFLLGSEQSPSTKGQDPAKALARP
jgi:hypothetical protein